MESDKTRLDKGREMFEAVYGDTAKLPDNVETNPFQRLMLENLFSEIWGRDAMSVRDRRLIIIGVIAAIAPDPAMLIEIQMRAALGRGELTREQLREIPLLLTQYVGYPRTVPVMHTIEKILADS